MSPGRPRAGAIVPVALAAAVLMALTGCGTSAAGETDGAASHQADAPTTHEGHHAASPAGAAPTRHIGPQGNAGQFVTDCSYSHSAPDDPIVYPSRPGNSHEHDFFGNTSTDAGSDLASLLEGDTTCQMKGDTAAYWAPQLRRSGQPVTPSKASAYYRAAPGVDPTAVEPYPPGLMIIAGDMTADAAAPQDPDLAGWTCGTSTTLVPSPPACPPSAPLRAVMTFPDCWDGRHLDSEDHRSHMTNSRDGQCPPTHPVHVPQLTFAVTYPVAGDPADLSLASGSAYGIHADFVNAWDQDRLVNEIESCLHRGAVCGLSSNRGEEPLFAG